MGLGSEPKPCDHVTVYVTVSHILAPEASQRTYDSRQTDADY